MDDPEYLPIMESFHTIQGEGCFTGQSAYFIRLGGCDVGCHWCDVKESWNMSEFDWVPVKQLVDEAGESAAEIVVITGGEPLMFDLSILTEKIREAGLRPHIETSGVHPLTGNWKWICFSPKKFKEPNDEFYQKSHELKIVIYNRHDIQWAKKQGERMNGYAKLYLQPEWSKAKEVTPLIVEFVKQEPKWRISLQTHKYMDIS